MAFRPGARRPNGAGLRAFCVFSLLILFAGLHAAWAQTDPLPSWNDGVARQSIITFVHDGTLWSEQPIYFQLAFALDRVKALAPKHPEWQTKQPFKAVLD